MRGSQDGRDEGWSLDPEELGRIATAALQDTSDACYVVSIPDYRFIFLNRSALAMLRSIAPADSASIEKLRPWDIIAGWDDAFLPVCEEVRRVRETRMREAVRYDVSGERRHWDIAFIPYTAKTTGAVNAIVVLARDVTDRELAREASKLQERLLRQFVMDNPAPVAMFDSDMRYLLYSRRWLTDYNLGDRDITGLSHYEVFPEIDERWKELHRRGLRGEELSCDEDRFVRSDGSIDWVKWVIHPWYTPGGAVGGIILLTEVITRRKQAENESRRVREQLQAIIDNSAAAVYLKDREGRLLVANAAMAGVYGMEVADVLGKTSYDLMPGEQAEAHTRNDRLVFETGRPIEIEEFVTSPAGLKTYITMKFPLRDASGEVYAVGGISTDITKRKEAERDLEAARAFAETERRRIAALESIAEAGISITESRELMSVLARRVADAAQATACRILLVDEQSGGLVPRASYSVGGGPIFDIELAMSAATEAVRRRASVTVSGDGWSILASPMVTRATSVGAICVGYAASTGPTDESRLTFQLVVSRSAQIIDNARLYDQLVASREEISENLRRELYVSHLLQQALLPPQPTIGPGYLTGHRYVPAYAGREIGGDFYDVFMTEDGKSGVMIGDVSGKGIEAASFAASTRSTVRAFAYDTSQPGSALSHANKVLHAARPGEQFAPFVTVFLAILDLQTGSIRYSTAGHPPPVVYKAATGQIETLAYGDPPIGIIDKYEFAEFDAELRPGDKLLLYTDGLSEMRNDGQMLDTAGIRDLLGQYGHLRADSLVETLLTAADAWAGAAHSDDTAIIAVERLASPAYERTDPG